MNAAIAGAGWVTPLGATLDDVWTGLMNDRPAHEVEVKSPGGTRVYPSFGVDEKLVRHLARTPRLRRSSSISYYTVEAGLAALADAGLDRETVGRERLALIFAVASGGVAYTRRFYEKVARDGASAASPLLFPETVYNAPASHLASLLGIDGATYTLVGDATVGIEALSLGAQLLEAGEADYCLVVGGEELDWILCEAYRQWRLLAAGGPPEYYADHPRGMRLSEGAAAILLAREGRSRIETLSGGFPFFSRGDVSAVLAAAVKNHAPADVIIASANGTFVDTAEREVFEGRKERSLFAPKSHFGESLGSGAIAQIVCAALALQKQELPGTKYAANWAVVNRESRTLEGVRKALVPVVGLNQQVATVTVSQ